MQLVKFGRLVQATGQINLSSTFSNLTNIKANEPALPAQYRPARNTSATVLFMGNNSQSFNLRIGSDGIMYISGSGAVGYYFSLQGSWLSD